MVKYLFVQNVIIGLSSKENRVKTRRQCLCVQCTLCMYLIGVIHMKNESERKGHRDED